MNVACLKAAVWCSDVFALYLGVFVLESFSLQEEIDDLTGTSGTGTNHGVAAPTGTILHRFILIHYHADS